MPGRPLGAATSLEVLDHLMHMYHPADMAAHSCRALVTGAPADKRPVITALADIVRPASYCS